MEIYICGKLAPDVTKPEEDYFCYFKNYSLLKKYSFGVVDP